MALLVMCIFLMYKQPSDLLPVNNQCLQYNFFCLACICCLRLIALGNTKGFLLLTTLYRFTKKMKRFRKFCGCYFIALKTIWMRAESSSLFKWYNRIYGETSFSLQGLLGNVKLQWIFTILEIQNVFFQSCLKISYYVISSLVILH